MRPPKFRTNRSIGRRVIAFPIFSDMAVVRHLVFFIFDDVAIIEVLICCCIPNFIKIGSRVWPPDTRNS